MKIALAQINPVIGDIEGNTRKIIKFIERAVSGNADLAIFPEMALTGYPAMDILFNRKLINDNLSSIEEISRHCRDIAVICGYADYDRQNPPMLYNAAAFMKEGHIASRHYKTLLPSYDVFDETRYFSSSGIQEPVNYKNRLIGITICEDIWNDAAYDSEELIDSRKYQKFPVRILHDKNIDLLINISASPFVKGKNKIKWNMISDIARKNKFPVIYVNQAGGNDSLIFDGKSFSMSREGVLTSMAKGFDEDMIIIDDSENKAVNIPEEDIEDIRKALVLGLRDYVHKCGFKKVVLGLSGGIDSALTAVLAVQALGPENVLGITMPSVYSSEGSIKDSVNLSENTGMRIEKIPISGIFNQYNESLSGIFTGMSRDVTEENIQARIRGTLLMAASNKFGSLPLTTGNKSELAMGYCTLYGDMAGGLAVISDLPKTMVYQLSLHINKDREIIPVESIEKAPSAELRENQKDQDSLPPYEILDEILELYIEKRESAGQIISRGYDGGTVMDVLRTVDRNEYKRRQASPGLKVTSKAFGTGRRIPMAQKYKP